MSDYLWVGAIVIALALLLLSAIGGALNTIDASKRMKRAGYVQIEVERTTVWAKPEDIRAILSGLPEDPQ